MTSLYSIIQQAKSATGSKEKTAVLMQHKDNELLKNYLKAVNDPSLSYYIAYSPLVLIVGSHELDQRIIDSVISTLAHRRLTGNAAREWLSSLMENLTEEGQYLLSLLIDRKVGEGVGSSCIMKVFPALWHEPIYSRCSLMSPKIKEAFNGMEFFYIQEKLDGSFAWAIKDDDGKSSLVTRQGNFYPQWMCDKILQGIPSGNVLAGELLVYTKEGTILDRQTGNGILNSILSGDEETARHAEYTYTLTAWDAITYDEFYVQKESKSIYESRLAKTITLVMLAENMSVVDTTVVYSLDEAFRIYARYLSENKEGAIIKSPSGVLKDNTSKDNVKLKMVFPIDLEVTGKYYGTGKYSTMLGGLELQSSDGLLKTNVGSGFTDLQRDYDMYKIGEIVTIKINDILTNESDSLRSCNLPIFVERRNFDKNVADSLSHIYAQRDAARYGTKVV